MRRSAANDRGSEGGRNGVMCEVVCEPEGLLPGASILEVRFEGPRGLDQ